MAPQVNPNFEEPQYPEIKPGSYTLRIKACDQRQSKQNGNPYLNWRLQIEGAGPVNGQIVFHMTGLTGKGAQALKELVRATVNPNYEGGPINTDDMIGFPLTAVIDKKLNPDGSESKYMQIMSVAPVSDSFEDFK